MRHVRAGMLVAMLYVAAVSEAATSRIVIEKPAGGEVYALGQAQKVRLGAKTRAKVVTVELSRDGGTTYEALGTIDNTVRDPDARNVLSFTVAGSASSNCVIRASGTVGTVPVSSVSSPFSIGSAGTLPGSVGTSDLANGAVTADKMASGGASGGMVLTADGSGGAGFAAPQSAASVASGAGNSVVAALNDPATTSKVNGGVLAAGSVTSAKLASFPKARVFNSANIPLDDDVLTTLQFDSERFDTDNCHDTATNPSLLICNTPGVYLISATMAFDNNSTGYRQAILEVNGISVAAERRQAMLTSGLTVTTIFQLAAGDQVRVLARQTSGSTLNVVKDSTKAHTPEFMMALLP